MMGSASRNPHAELLHRMQVTSGHTLRIGEMASLGARFSGGAHLGVYGAATALRS
jgi:hypothetical protein